MTPIKVCGVAACASSETIEARIFDIEKLDGEWDENETILPVDKLDRLELHEARMARVGERRGGDTSTGEQSNRANSPEWKGQRTRDVVAKQSGLGSATTARNLRAVRDRGTPELQQAVRQDRVSPSAGARIAALPPAKQRAQLDGTAKPTAAAAARAGATGFECGWYDFIGPIWSMIGAVERAGGMPTPCEQSACQ